MSETSNGIRIVAAIGSVRPGNQTAKALALAVDEMRKHDGIEVEVIDPAEVAMSLPGTAKDPAVMQSLQAKVTAAAGVVLATPEYHGWGI